MTHLAYISSQTSFSGAKSHETIKYWGIPPMLALFTSLIIILFITKAFYNRYLHPLAKFPGPFWGSLSDLYFAITIAAVPTAGLHLHAKYGPIVRLAPNLLSFDDATMLPKVYHRHADKPKFYQSWIFGKTEPMFQSLGHADHARKRRVVGHCCSMLSMKIHHEAKLDQRIQDLCAQIQVLSCRTGQSIDFSEYLRWFLADTWSHLVYGAPDNCVSQGKDVNGIIGALQGIYTFQATTAVLPWLVPLLQSDWLRSLLWCHTPVFNRINILFKNFDRKFSSAEPRSHVRKEHLFFDDLASNANPDEDRFEREDIRAEVITFTAATLDGVAAFIAPFIDNMLQHPDFCHRLRAEIETADRENLLSRPVVRYDETTRLPFFMACFKETMRRDTPAQTILPRLVSEPGYWLKEDIFVPGGAIIGASPPIIHRDPTVFGPAPELFRPARWIIGEGGPYVTQESIHRMETLGMWWGWGDRECAGKHYAKMQCQKLLVELFRRFEFTSESLQGRERFKDERWGVRMFWKQHLFFQDRSISDCMNKGGVD